MEGTAERIKGFWQRKEGVLSVITLLGIGGVGLYFWSLIAAFMVSLLANTILAAALAAVVLISAYALTRKSTWIILAGVMRGITASIFDLDPVRFMQACLARAKQYLHELAETIGKVASAMERFDELERSSAQRQKDFMSQAVAARQSGNMVAARKGATLGAMRGRTLQEYAECKARLSVVHQLLERVHELCQEKVEYMSEEVSIAGEKQEAFGAFAQAIRAARNIIKDNGSVMGLYDLAKERAMLQQRTMLDEINGFKSFAERFIGSVDVESGIIEKKALTELDAWEKKLATGSVLGSDAKVSAILSQSPHSATSVKALLQQLQ